MAYCSLVAVPVLVDLTKRRFGHYAILKILSLRSPSNNRYLQHCLILSQSYLISRQEDM